jgi:hypothetical protein
MKECITLGAGLTAVEARPAAAAAFARAAVEAVGDGEMLAAEDERFEAELERWQQQFWREHAAAAAAASTTTAGAG